MLREFENLLFITAVCVAAPFLGFLMPKFDVFGGAINYVNLPWSTLFGIGWWAFGQFAGFGSSATNLFGYIAWPLIVEIGLACCAVVISKRGRAAMLLSVTVVALTALANVTPEQAVQAPYDQLPTFWKFYVQAD